MRQTPWNDQDAALLRQFIERNPKFLDELETRVPKIITDQTIEIAAMTGSRHAGATELVKVIKEDMQAAQGEIRSTPFFDASKD